MSDATPAAPLARTARPSDTLARGLHKAVADPAVEWVDANIIRLLLDRYDAATAHPIPPIKHARRREVGTDGN